MRKRTYEEIAADAFFEMCGSIDWILHSDGDSFIYEMTDSEKLKCIEKVLATYRNKVKEEREQLEV